VQKVLQYQWNLSESTETHHDVELLPDSSGPNDAPLLEPNEGVSLVPEEQAQETEPSTTSSIGRVMRLFTRP
jgi:hypothetical protein